MIPKSFPNLVMLITLLATGFFAPAPKPSSPIDNQPNTPPIQNLPAVMPVYAFFPTTVDPDTINRSAGLFSGVGATDVMTYTSPGGLAHLFAFNSSTGAIVDQYNHTGGLFALNGSRVFTETQMTAQPTNIQICDFLGLKQLFPSGLVDPLYMDCAGDPPYIVKQIHLATLTPATGASTQMEIGQLVQIPLAKDIGGMAGPVYVPLGGPGGHLSLLFSGGPRDPALDDTLPAVQAIAAPLYQRLLNPTPIGEYPLVPRTMAIQRFKAMYPADARVDAGAPELVYYVGYPDAPQDAMMPMWTFPDATANISGTLVSLKDSAIPGVDGFAPQVTIQSPLAGAFIPYGQPASMTFSITGDQGPFTYTVSADDTEVASGVTVSGTLTLDLGVLPFPEGKSEGHSLSVHAENSYHQPGEAAVLLGTESALFLPIALNGSSALAPARQSAPAELSQPFIDLPPALSPDAVAHVGIEWVMNYHNPDSNLGLTKADAQGFYNYLGSFGWQRSFNYGDDAAWEKDWRDCTLGGIDCSIGVDRVEFSYFSGHGSPSSWYFGVNRDYGGAWGGNSRFQNVRWASFSTCQTIRGGPYVGPGNPPLTDWFNSFKGSYMLLGFHSTMKDVAFGSQFAFNAYNPLYTFWPSMQPAIREAWVKTAFQMNAGKPAYLYAVGNFNPVNYKLPSPGHWYSLPALSGIYEFRWVWWDE